MPEPSDHQFLLSIERHRSLLVTVARSLIGGKLKRKLDPEDLVQEVMKRAAEAFGEFEGKDDPEKVKAWLMTILENQAKDLFKHFSTGKRNLANEQSAVLSIQDPAPNLEALVPAGQTSPSIAVIRNEQSMKLAQALQQVPSDVREIVDLKHLQGKTLKEISEITGRSVPSVAGALRRGLAQLRLYLE